MDRNIKSNPVLQLKWRTNLYFQLVIVCLSQDNFKVMRRDSYAVFTNKLQVQTKKNNYSEKNEQ